VRSRKQQPESIVVRSEPDWPLTEFSSVAAGASPANL